MKLHEDIAQKHRKTVQVENRVKGPAVKIQQCTSYLVITSFIKGCNEEDGEMSDALPPPPTPEITSLPWSDAIVKQKSYIGLVLFDQPKRDEVRMRQLLLDLASTNEDVKCFVENSGISYIF